MGSRCDRCSFYGTASASCILLSTPKPVCLLLLYFSRFVLCFEMPIHETCNKENIEQRDERALQSLGIAGSKELVEI